MGGSCHSASSKPAINFHLQHVKHVAHSQIAQIDVKEEEYKESVQALKVLFEGKNPPAPSNVQSILVKTFSKRREWLKTSLISIHCIVEVYPLFMKSKWVWHFLNEQVMHIEQLYITIILLLAVV